MMRAGASHGGAPLRDDTLPALAAAALFALAPLWPALPDLRAGLRYAVATAAALLMLQALLSTRRASSGPSAFGATLWSTVTAASAGWLLLAWNLLTPPHAALLPLVVANAAWWHAAHDAPRTPLAFSAVLALAPVVAALLRAAADALGDAAGVFGGGAAVWLRSAPGWLIAAALALALARTLQPRPAGVPDRNPPAP